MVLKFKEYISYIKQKKTKKNWALLKVPAWKKRILLSVLPTH